MKSPDETRLGAATFLKPKEFGHEPKVAASLSDIGIGRGFFRLRLEWLLRGAHPTASAARLWICRRGAWARICMGGWILGLARRRLELGARILGPATETACGVDCAGLAALRTRIPILSRALEILRTAENAGHARLLRRFDCPPEDCYCTRPSATMSHGKQTLSDGGAGGRSLGQWEIRPQA